MMKHKPRPFGTRHDGPELPQLPKQSVDATGQMGMSGADKDGRSPAHKPKAMGMGKEK